MCPSHEQAASELPEVLLTFACLCLAALRTKGTGKAPSVYKSVIGKTVLIPASVFGVDVPELWYKGQSLLETCIASYTGNKCCVFQALMQDAVAATALSADFDFFAQPAW